MLKSFFALVFLCASALPVLAAETLKQYVNRQTLGGRYMSLGGGCAVATQDLLNWPASELQECRYEVTDNSRGHKSIKRGLAFLANPTPDRVLKWLNAACNRVRISNIDGCVRSAAKDIRVASGAQFPVAGVVWEDLNGDGIYEAYIFRNGVTVRVENFSSGDTARIDDNNLTDLAILRKIVGVKKTGGYARISSTTRNAFARFTKRSDIPVNKFDAAAAEEWSRIVGETYRAALSTDENPLISAWLCNKRRWPRACD